MVEVIMICILVIGVLSIVIFNKIKKKRTLNNPTYIKLNNSVNKFLREIEHYKTMYFRYSVKEELRIEYINDFKLLSSHPTFVKINKNGTFAKFHDIYKNLDHFVKEWNEQYVTQELESNQAFLSDIDGKSLDPQQRKAVVIDEDNNLVIAGAGSGKTLTITGKVKYLVEKKRVKDDEILLISFTKKATDEMQERISQKLNIGVEAKTFHKLGLDIISKKFGYRPDVFQDIDEILDNYLSNELIKDTKSMSQIITFFGYYLNIPKDMEEFENLGEAQDYYRNIDLETLRSKVLSKTNELKRQKVTIQGERVKSIEEVIIANFLYLNGINYEYERVYPYASSDPYRKKYRPDFYLSDYDLYLEHFGITKDCRVPWLSEVEEKKYLEGIKWKRGFHNKNNTTLLETYSYYNKDGVLLSELEKILKSSGVAFSEIDYGQVYENLFAADNGNKYFTEFKKLIKTFIGLYKSKGFLEDQFRQLHQDGRKIENNFLKRRTELFLSIVKPIYEKYQKYLKESDQIDFNDMINLATDIVQNEETDLNFKYIIIDEYQDISFSRFKLIKEIKNQTNAKILCVGDDWQSIYRFAGSDIDLFTSFEKYFGYSVLLKIEKTYRNSQELINIAGQFISANPKQIKKELVSDKHNSNPIRIITYDKSNNMDDWKLLQSIEKAIDEIVYLNGESTQILILGRNNFDINVFTDDKNDNNNAKDNEIRKRYRVKKVENRVVIQYAKYPNLEISFLTTHRSKGLEAENVIVINLENKLVGFPNKISDDPVLSLVLTDLDTFAYAEERRLFYVALTRTQNNTYLIAPEYGQSVFVDELIKKQGIKFDTLTGKNSLVNNPNCPKCEKGYLILRENTNNRAKFLGCTNYPLCDNTFKQIALLDNYITCPKCGGYMVKRNGKYGVFYGCTNYPFCKNKFNIEGRNVKASYEKI
ncbi:UvrD-helicase domain-containing protein [Virgibacillus kekensis]|uniref:DNA 3'-5' helicase n=1 Tax=Virgibacillus kekensis TaxID=202261 RepID=A0ABV9DLX2_9BACI